MNGDLNGLRHDGPSDPAAIRSHGYLAGRFQFDHALGQCEKSLSWNPHGGGD